MKTDKLNVVQRLHTPEYSDCVCYIIDNCLLANTITGMEEPTTPSWIFVGVTIFLILIAEIDKVIF